MTVAPAAPTLLVGPAGGQTTLLAATAATSSGSVRSGAAVVWSSSNASIATVGATGLVTAVNPGSVTVSATIAGVTGSANVTVSPVPAASVELTQDSIALRAGRLGNETAQLVAVLRDSTGAALIGRAVSWVARNASVASVSAGGLVTALDSGSTRIVATSVEGRADSLLLRVTRNDTLPSDADIRVVAVNWTQAVQTDSNAIPMVRGGRPAVVNVLLAATREITTPSKVVLRLFDAGGAIVRADTATVTVSPAVPPSFSAPNAQFLVPAAQLVAGRRWEVIRDPAGLLPDGSAANDRYPRSGPVAVNLVDVPTLKLRFIPIVLTAHNNVTGNVSQANLAEYLRVVRALHPHGPLSATIGDPLPSARSFGTAPSGGQSAFWIGVLTDVDAARIADPTYADAHWIGVVAPPTGFNFTAFGGFGYIPANGTSFAAGTRTSTLVNIGWFSRESQSRELVAHELGHNFGRQHAPCGGAGGPDANFPNTSGTVGDGGHDVNAWALGLLNSAPAIATGSGDVMGYCTPVWSSRYTYQGILDFRTTTPAALSAPLLLAAPQRIRALVIRGTSSARGLRLDPAVTLDVIATEAEGGDHVVEGLAAGGRILFRRTFRPAMVDHDATVRPFTVTVPLSEREEADLESIVVSGPTGSIRRARTGANLAAPGESPTLSGTTVTCPSGTALIAVHDDASGRVLGMAEGPTIRLPREPRARVRVACSDGVRTAAARIAPR